jgi:hypothetical protein
MSSRTRAHLAGLSALLVTAGLAFGLSAPPPAKDAPAAGPAVMPYRVSDALAHENLTIFFLFGEDQIKGKKILTLDEALKEKKVIVHETKNVNELAVENVSAEEVFVQAGDIVKGGQQDRTIALDVLIQPKSGRIPVGSFCVEQGRWSRRGGEDAKAFNDNRYVITGNPLKIAARSDKSQGGVWKEVGQQQEKLAKVLKAEVKDSRSQSSLQLTLENKKVQEAIDSYLKKFEKGLPAADAGNTIGFAVAINGQVMSADVYANADLFRRLWPKLLRSTVIEAVSEKNDKVKVVPVRPEAVSSFLADVTRGKRSERQILNGRLKEVQLETSKNVFFETKTPMGAVLRQSYIAK